MQSARPAPSVPSILAMLLFASPGLATAPGRTAQDPVDEKSPAAAAERRIHGFRVLVRPGFDRSPLHDRVFEELGCQLYQIGRAIGDAPLQQLRRIPIWVGDEAAFHREKCMFYHPSAQWLKEHEPGREFLAGSVEIACAANFLAWTRDQPWMVLHELAHGFHDQVLGHGHDGVRRAFTAARDSLAYVKVLHVAGREVKHYALTNDQEWFAEATEAYFGTNDFHPFVRAELRQVDPQGHAELVRIWGEPRR